jgi:hypothetical protein
MFPNMQTGTIGIASDAFSGSSESWLEIDLGFVPEVLVLLDQDNAMSSTVGGGIYNFNDASSSVVKKFWQFKEVNSNSEFTLLYQSSSTGYAVKVMDQHSYSSSSSDLTAGGKKGFKLYKTAAAAWKSGTIQYFAFPKMGARVKNFTSMGPSSAAGS